MQIRHSTCRSSDRRDPPLQIQIRRSRSTAPDRSPLSSPLRRLSLLPSHPSNVVAALVAFAAASRRQTSH
ncbi:hypothetical protein VIGAN_02283700 [Vigna angularis var. angularis]|uniref:Uncharacterized protein n=1 Tax=Vigna angularis var. angularis TaxID=157739 RepID=A0A0S3RGX3_PHAAN|nr:hypothetical protein VIGAN_02283700 [Vigna angularis var. angularis]